MRKGSLAERVDKEREGRKEKKVEDGKIIKDKMDQALRYLF